MRLAGKHIVITGINSERSIAYGIAKACKAEGAELILTYNNPRFEARLKQYGETFEAPVVTLDAADDASMDAAAEAVKAIWPDGVDGVLHSIAWAPREAIAGSFLDGISREGFHGAMNVSVYSFAGIMKAFAPQMTRGGAFLTLSYLGSERVVPNYNTMGVAKAALEATVRYAAADLGPKGIRVNALSCGPVKTLAAAGIKHFSKMLNENAAVAPMRANITLEDVGATAAFYFSDAARMTTGQTIYIDGGFEMMAPGAAC